ncbi:MAG: Gfo/Idh/MocA family protein [Alphaproteobacteria bacterium]
MALRLGLVGRGRWGRNIERTLATFPDVSVINIARGERRPESLDGVLIATPSASHAETALPYIEAGIATFIEKPMATSIQDAERIRDAAARSGAPVFVGHIYLYHPAFLAALALLPSLGPVRFLICEGANDSPRADSSVLWDWLPHDLSMARAVFGRDADSVRAWKLLGDSRAEVAASEIQFGDTGVVSMMSWHSPVRTRRVTIVCDKGVVVFDDKAEARLAVHGRDGGVTHPLYSPEPPLTCQIKAFLEAVHSRKLEAPHIETGMAIARAIAAVEHSIEAGGNSVPI